jgi:serine/threonine protein kinase
MLIAGKYQLVRELGRGTMGSVWEAWHLSLRSPVAVKLMAPSIAASPFALQRFLREARAAAGLRSPHVVQVLDHGVDHGLPYIVMELLEGEALAERLARVGRLSPKETARIVTHIARALTRAQQAGITHRDLKPENVFLVRNDDEELVKVLDFGVAKVEQRYDGSFNEESTAAGALLGTPFYSSPEQAEGLKSVDHRTDLWSLGVMTYECLLGRRPFHGDGLPAVLLSICTKPLPVPSRAGLGPVPRGFDAWFAKACARNMAERFASAKDMAAELTRLCADAGEADPEPISRRARLPPLAPLPSLPKLGDDDDDDDQAPTEIWRGGPIAELVSQNRISSLPPPSSARQAPPSSARQAPPSSARQAPPSTARRGVVHRPPPPAPKRGSQVLLATLPALGVGAFAWFFYGERLAYETVTPPHSSSSHAAMGDVQRVTANVLKPPAPSVESAAPSASVAPIPELVPTVDVKQLPQAVGSRPSSRLTKPKAPAQRPRALNDDEGPTNPYR